MAAGTKSERVGIYSSLFTLTLAATAFLPTKSFAWGYVGHMAVATIAEEHLSPEALVQVKLLLGEESMSEASIWPDRARSLDPWQHTKPYHFTGTPDGWSYFEELEAVRKDRLARGDMMRAVIKAEDVLLSAETLNAEKVIALRFLIHLIGDIHQPLHTGRKKDLGGNRLYMDWPGRRTNLHQVWDSVMIRELVRARPKQRKSAVDVYLQTLPHLTQDLIRSWQQSYYGYWHADAMIGRDGAYEDRPLSKEYYLERNSAVLGESIQKAGVRLAAVLNWIFTGAPNFAPEAQAFRKMLSDVVGSDHAEHVSFLPYQGDSRMRQMSPASSQRNSDLEWFAYKDTEYEYEFGSHTDNWLDEEHQCESH